MKKWERLPRFMQCDEVREYYDILCKKSFSLALKRVFDIVVASMLLVVCAVPMIVIGIKIVTESEGGILIPRSISFPIISFRTSSVAFGIRVR